MPNDLRFFFNSLQFIEGKPNKLIKYREINC